MAVKVAKFGGSSVADGIQIRKIKEIIDADQERKFIVVSAPGKRFDGDNKITDILYMCKASIERNLPYNQLFQVVVDRFRALQADLGTNINLDAEFQSIRENLEQGCSLDYIASRGEYLNALVISNFLDYDFVDTASLILFDSAGKLMRQETDESLKRELSKHEKAVIPGFYGTAEEDGQVITFSRGGSDITGALVARAVEASVYENWTDVSGFLMADPRIVPSPKQISTISYKELRELSYMGASVLHEDAIYPARMSDIPINIRNTNEPENPGTMITAEPEQDGESIITGIAGSKDFVVIAIYKNMMSSDRGFMRRLFGVLEDFNIGFEHLPSGIDTVSVVVSKEDLAKCKEEFINALQVQLSPDSLQCHEDIALIATVGSRMSNKPGVSAKLFTALADANINIRMIDQGSSEMNIIVGVENNRFEDAIRAIYSMFERSN